MLAAATKLILGRRLPNLLHALENPVEAQEDVLKQLLRKARNTAWGQQYQFRDIGNYRDYQSRVPLHNYDLLLPWIERAQRGEADVLWPGRVKWFSRSSGTTQQRSKFIPITPESLDENHYKAGRDMGALYLRQRPDSHIFEGYGLSIGGSHSVSELHDGIRAGDLSAVLIENMPKWYEGFRTPSRDVALLGNWEEKLERIADQAIPQNITNLHGVPSWTLVLLQRVLQRRGATTLAEVWPHLEVFFHGGVSFLPYRETFERITKGCNMQFMETYNASEGFFAVRDDATRDDMALMVNHGIFFEFIPLDEHGQETAQCRTAGEVEIGKTYALVVSTCGGLWRYQVGDTVTITSLKPLRLRVAGRTAQFLNVFGEEVMVSNAEVAIARACHLHQCEMNDYTVAPLLRESASGGNHEWAVEFRIPPQDLTAFAISLDNELRLANSDYDAKRNADLILGPAIVRNVPGGSFEEWLRRKGQLGGQHKVPRLLSHRNVLEEILQISASR